MRRALWTVGLWLLLAARVHAQAQPQAPLPLELAWQAPAECGSVADVRAELERVARARSGFALAPLRAQARVDRQERGYALQLTTEHEGERGERRLEAHDCPTLVRSMTLVLALAFGKGVELSDGTGAASKSDAASTPAAAASPATSNANPSPEAQPAKPVPDRQDTEANEDAQREEAADDGAALRLSVLIGGGVQLALLPDPALAGSLGAELADDAWSIALRARVWPASTSAVALELDARFDGSGAELQGCRQQPLAAVELALCATASAAGLRGRSQGAFEDGSDTAPWYALGALASATWPRASVIGVRLEAALALSLARPRFVIAGFGPVHRVPLLAPQLGALLVITP